MYYTLAKNSLVEINRSFNYKKFTGSASYDYSTDNQLIKKSKKNSAQHDIYAISSCASQQEETAYIQNVMYNWKKQ